MENNSSFDYKEHLFNININDLDVEPKHIGFENYKITINDLYGEEYNNSQHVKGKSIKDFTALINKMVNEAESWVENHDCILTKPLPKVIRISKY